MNQFWDNTEIARNSTVAQEQIQHNALRLSLVNVCGLQSKLINLGYCIDKILKKRTLLVPEDIVELLEFVLTTTYFMFRTSIPTEVRYSHGPSSVTNCGKSFHGGP